MTVADNTSRNQYTATSGQTVFAYTFEIVDKDDIVVLKNGATLSEGTNYTVSNVGNDSGGNVTLTAGATAGDILTLYRDMPYARTQNYTNSGDFLASEVNSDFDNLWLAGEQTNRSFSQSIRKPITDSDSISMELPEAANRADRVLTFDSTGAVTTSALPGVSPTTIFRQQFTGNGSTTVFTLSSDLNSGVSVIIYIDGVYQEGNTYTVSGTTLTFSEAPPTNASIEVLDYKIGDISVGDATSIAYLPAGTGAVQTTVQSKLRESVSVKDFGAFGDGVSDDTTAIQAAIDYGLSAGVEVFFPGGRYRTTSQLTIDDSSSSVDPTDGAKMLSLRGASPASSMIVADHNGIALSFIGGLGAGWHTYLYIDGIGLTKSNKNRDSGSIGFNIDDCAFAQIQRFEVSYFEYGIKGTDVLSSAFVDGTIRLNNYGFQFEKGTRSNPNVISFRGVITLNNQIYGGQVIKPHTFNYIGGSIESNGFTGTPGDTSSWGIDLQNSGAEGTVAVNLIGVYIEGNNGSADVKITSSTNRAVYNVSGCSFLRFSDIASRYTTNNIFFNNITESKLVVTGCGFKDIAPYVSDASRLFIAAPNCEVIDAGSNLFYDSSGGQVGLSRAIFSPVGVNHQIDFASLPDVAEYRNGIQFCSDGTGSSLPSLAVSDGTNWNQIPIGQFSGRVDSTGTSLRLPRGFTCSRASAGVYTITHNLNLSANTYSVIGSPSGLPGTGYCSGSALSGNSFEIYFSNTSGTATDMDFNFNMQII